MGAGAASKYAELSTEDKQTAIKELSPEQKTEIAKSLKEPTSDASATNKANIKENKSKLHELESVVLGNKQKLYGERAYIEENRALILKNYSAAFAGNRQMANINTDDIFRNRKAILKSMKAADAVQLNHIDSHTNRARVDYIEHRAKMNSRVAEVNKKMSEINALLIDVNSSIMEGNKEIVGFNSKHIEVNTKLLNGELTLDGCNPEDNAKRIEDNKKRIAEITETAAANSAKYDEIFAMSKANREKVLKNSDDIYERRGEIEENHTKIQANAAKISAMILKE
jgi:hypothetical protein